MLKQHTYYIYNDGPRVMARMEDKAPVVAETCEGGSLGDDGEPMTAAQEAGYKVQSILNPAKRSSASFGAKGFSSPEFQAQISPRCEAYVKAAYGPDATASAITED